MKIKFKHSLIFLTVILVVVIAYSFIPDNPEDEVENANINYGSLEEVVFEVKTTEILKGDLVKSVSANGIARAFNEVDIIANTTGYINNLDIYEGKSVSKGSLLLSLDDREHKIALEEAQSKLNEAKIQYVIQKREIGEINTNEDGLKIRNELLKLENEKIRLDNEQYEHRKNVLEAELILSGAEREKVVENRSGLTSARINFERAKLLLSYTKITAPFNGLISDLNLTEGTRVSSGEKLFRLVDVDRIKIDVGVLESDIASIRTGSNAQVIFNALPGKQFYGEIIFINPCIDPATKTCRVTVEVQNRNNRIKPGMFAAVVLSSQVLKNRILIPRTALVNRDRRNLVFVQEGELAKWKYIDIGEQNENYIEVINGVEPGEKVIIEGNFNLAHDAKIKVKQQPF